MIAHQRQLEAGQELGLEPGLKSGNLKISKTLCSRFGWFGGGSFGILRDLFSLHIHFIVWQPISGTLSLGTLCAGTLLQQKRFLAYLHSCGLKKWIQQVVWVSSMQHVFLVSMRHLLSLRNIPSWAYALYTLMLYSICVSNSYIDFIVYFHVKSRTGFKKNSSFVIKIGFSFKLSKFVKSEKSKFSIKNSYPELQSAITMKEFQMSIERFFSEL